MDIDRLQRTDIDKVTDDRITLALDSFNTVRSPYVHETFDDYKCNNWVLIEDEFVKYNLAEDDNLTLVYDPITNLSEKDIKKIIVSFDYELEDYDSLPILDNVSILHDSIDYLSTNLELNDEMHMDIDCLLFGIDNEVLNNIISERGFGIGLNFNGNKSNATLKLSNIHLSFEFANKLSDETDAVVNRLIPEVDFWREGSKLYLQVGGVDKSKEHESSIDSYTKDEVDELLLGKVNIEVGKGLSANDYTLAEKNKLQSIENGANNYVHPLVHNTNIIVEPNALVNIGTNALDNQETINSAIDSVLEEKADISSFGAVALSNDYDDLDNKPLIPENISDLNNDSNFIEKSNINGLIKNDGNIDTTQYLSELPTHTHGEINDDGTIFLSSIAPFDMGNMPLVRDKVTGKIKLSDLHTTRIKDSNAHTNIGTNANDTQTTINNAIDTALSNKANNNDIPTNISDLVDDSDFITTSETVGLIKNDGSIDTTRYLSQHQDLSNYLQKSNVNGLVKNDGTIDTTTYLSSLPSHNHDDRYYTESEVDAALSGKQEALISGTNIKTVNNTSLLGSGNITISGGGSSVDIVTDWESTLSDSKVPSEKLTKDTLDGKSNLGHTHGDNEIESNYHNQYGVIIHATLDEHLEYIKSKIPSSVPTVNIAQEMAEILTHIDTNWIHYD